MKATTDPIQKRSHCIISFHIHQINSVQENSDSYNYFGDSPDYINKQAENYYNSTNLLVIGVIL